MLTVYDMNALWERFKKKDFTEKEEAQLKRIMYPKQDYDKIVKLWLQTQPEIKEHTPSDVYRDYELWCARVQTKPMSPAQFSRELCSEENLKSVPKKINGKVMRVYRSIW